MISVLARRIGFALAVMLGAGVVVAFLLSVVPDRAADASVWHRFADNLSTLLTFDYGVSEAENVPVSLLLWDRGINSLILIGGAACILAGVGVPLGLGGALRPESRVISGMMSVVNILSSIPILVWAFALLIASGAAFGVYPAFNNLGVASTGEQFLIYAVPIMALGLGDGMLSDVVRTVRSEAGRELRKQYVRALRARSTPITRHLWRGVVAPTFSAIANKVTYLISGTIVVEYIFNVNGLAYQIYNSITGVKDYDFVMAATMIFVVAIVGVGLVGDLLAVATDPRLRMD